MYIQLVFAMDVYELKPQATDMGDMRLLYIIRQTRGPVLDISIDINNSGRKTDAADARGR